MPHATRCTLFCFFCTLLLHTFATLFFFSCLSLLKDNTISLFDLITLISNTKQ